MRKIIMAGALGALGVLCPSLWDSQSQDKTTFGGGKDVSFAKDVWKAIQGYENWKLTSEIDKGQSPHGKWVRMFSTFVKVRGKSYPIIVKDNYGGRGVTVERIQKDSDAWLKAVTIILKREPGYDTDNQDWFWVKYGKDGSIEKGPKGTLLAGRVAKGMKRGCISCHSQAGGDDYLFSNDQ